MEKIAKGDLYPILFEPIYIEIMWGGDLMTKHLKRKLPKRDTPIAEAWEISDRPDAKSVVENGSLAGMQIDELLEAYNSDFMGSEYKTGESFPLLVKLIDSGKRLSLQVHPDEEACKILEGAEPKTEMWYIIAAEPEAKIIAGLNPNCTQRKFIDDASTDAVMDDLQVFKSVPGDAYYINSGRVHAIDAGNLLLEIQQNSNTTYRLSDWGRVGIDGKPRELHLEQALQCINFADRSSPRISGVIDKAKFNRKFPIINSCPFFQVFDLRIVDIWNDSTDGSSFHLLTAINNDISILGKSGKTVVAEGRSCVIPANYGKYQIEIKDGKETTVIKTTL